MTTEFDKPIKEPPIDPWGSILIEDYQRMIESFGLEPFDVGAFPKPNRLMRRGAVFAGRDLKQIAEAVKLKKKFYVLSGIMPSAEKVHFGTKMVVEQVSYFQQHGGKAYVLVADLEAAATRGISLEEAQERAMNFHIPAYIALGLDAKKTTFYFQSENKEVMRHAYEFAKKITLNEFRSIYGHADPSRIISALTQAGDILYPQLKEKMPGIIPVGVDQDPHIRLARDIVHRTRSTHKFWLPSSIYHKFTPALNGEFKMSKSKPESMIELPEDMASVRKKIMKALSGGRGSLEEHRKLGGEPEKDMVFELLKQHLVEDDAELKDIYDEYKSGKMATGELKQLGVDKMEAFMSDFSKKLEKARKIAGKLNFVKF